MTKHRPPERCSNLQKKPEIREATKLCESNANAIWKPMRRRLHDSREIFLENLKKREKLDNEWVCPSYGNAGTIVQGPSKSFASSRKPPEVLKIGPNIKPEGGGLMFGGGRGDTDKK